MNPENQPPAASASPLVRWFLVGLPLGLIITGALSFVIYFQKRHAKEVAASAPSRYASMLRRELNLDDFRRYVRIFDREIGPRTADKPENIEAARSFIESTLGFGNMGYQVVRREAEVDGKACVYLEVELKGRSPAGGVRLITARYDGADAKDIASLLCLANAFTGMSHRDTIRFVAWFGGKPGAGFQPEHYLRWLPDIPESSIRVLELDGPGAEDRDALDRLESIEREIQTLAGDEGGVLPPPGKS